MKTVFASLMLVSFLLTANAQLTPSLKFYGTNGNVGFRYWTLGDPCNPTVIGQGAQYWFDGTNWHGGIATVGKSTNALGQPVYTYNSGNYGGPTNSFTITLCIPEVPNVVPYSFECLGDDLGVFTLTIPAE